MGSFGGHRAPRAGVRRAGRAARTIESLLFAFVLLGTIGLVGCNSTPTKSEIQIMNQDGFGKRYIGNPEEEAYAKPGDTIRIFDEAHPDDLDLTRKINFDGTILLPEIGRLSIAGYRRSEIESTLIQRYSSYYTDAPQIVVELPSQKLKYYVVGEVLKEGDYPLESNLTIFDAVLTAGVMRDSANLGRILLIRPDPVDPVRLSFNFKDFVPGGDSTMNIALRENDIVYVPPTLIAEFGYFLRSALFPVTTVFQAIGGALIGLGNQGRINQGGNNRSIFGFGGIF